MNFASKFEWTALAGIVALAIVAAVHVGRRAAEDESRVVHFNSILDLSLKGRARKPDPVPDWRPSNPVSVDKFGLSMTARPIPISEILTDKQKRDIEYVIRHCREVVRVDCLPPR